MLLSLEEVKLYLRIDGDEEDTLITSLIKTSQEICEEILGFPIIEFEQVPQTVKQAMLFCIANIYEKREGTAYFTRSESRGIKETINIMKLILNSYRKGSW